MNNLRIDSIIINENGIFVTFTKTNTSFKRTVFYFNTQIKGIVSDQLDDNTFNNLIFLIDDNATIDFNSEENLAYFFYKKHIVHNSFEYQVKIIN